MRKLIDALHRLAQSFSLALCKLNEMQFSAPWNPGHRRCGGSGL